jgi:UDP-N-acetylglucosamine/UDP-N-acetylgalactosamine diphosphorylase
VLHKPDAPNAIKLERFVFDLLPLADRTLVVEGDASQVFAPVKNAEGAPTDTPSAAKQALCALHKRWLRDAGCVVADDAKVEIHPLCAWDAEEVRSKFSQSIPIDADTYLID